MKNKMFLALVLFGLVTLGFAAESKIPSIQNYLENIQQNDKLPKQEINIPYIQNIPGGSNSEKDKPSDNKNFNFDIKDLLSQIQYEEAAESKKNDKPSEPEQKKDNEKPSYSEPKKDINKPAKSILKQKIAKLTKLQSSLKQVRERQHTSELNREKVQEVSQE